MLGEGGVHPDLRTSVDDAHAIGPDEPHAESPGELDQIAIGARPRGLLVRLARRDDDEAANPLCSALAHNLGHSVSRHREQCQIDGAGHIGHAAIRPETSDRVGLPIDRVDVTGELPGEEIADDVVARRAWLAARLDDGDSRGTENVLDRAHRCGPFAFLDPLDVLRLSRELQRHPDNP